MKRAYVPGKLMFRCLLTIVLGLPTGLAWTAQQPGPPQPPLPLPAQPAPQAHPLDAPIGWLKEAQNNYSKVVQNYTCTLIKKERINGVMQEPNIILFSSKVHPFSVYMKWVGPAKANGREVCYVQGRHNDQIRVKDSRPIGGLVWISISPDDPRVMRESRHNIREAGLGNMIVQNLRSLETAREINKTGVKIAEFKFDNRVCYRIETRNDERHPKHYCYRSVLYLEKESKIPMRLENYDWPTAANPEGELIEEFSYASLQFNVPMSENLFNK
jgi:hypothetical protein